MDENKLDDILSFLNEKEDEEYNDNAKAPFAINSEDLANWAVKKVKDAQIVIQNNNDKAKAMREKYNSYIDEWLKKVNTEHENKIKFFSDKLEEYLRDIVQDKKANLLYGTIRYKKQQDECCIEDEEALINFIKNNNIEGLLKTEYKVKKTDLKKLNHKNEHYVYNDVPIPGVLIKARDPKFEVV